MLLNKQLSDQLRITYLPVLAVTLRESLCRLGKLDISRDRVKVSTSFRKVLLLLYR
jgi:hypothetical protein